MTESDIMPEKAKGGVNWILWVQIALVILIVVIMVFKAQNKPEMSQESYCASNPTDNSNCQCVKTMMPHTRFWTGFNDTTPDLIRTMNETGRSPYSETMTVEVYGNNQTGVILIKNLTPNYYLIYNYEVVEEKCAEAKPKEGSA